MIVVGWSRSWVLGVALMALACNTTEPPGPPAQVVKSGGDAQAGFFNTPLPMPYSVTVYDANNRPVPGVSVASQIITRSAPRRTNPRITNPSRGATTNHTPGTTTPYAVRPTVTGQRALTGPAPAR